MKKNIMLFLLLLAFMLPATAHDFEVDGIYYNINGTEATVTYGETGRGEYYGDIIIPATVTYANITYAVTSIGGFAFFSCKGLTSVTIPNSVTCIGEYAFSASTGLTSIVIPNSVTSIGMSAFATCKGLSSIDIPNSVASIGEYAFYDCSGLTSIVIPNSVTSIGFKAFLNCTSLSSIVVASDNTTYDSRNNCKAIIETASNKLITGCKKTVIPNSVTCIGEYAFFDCSGLTSIDIPNSVTYIGEHAFSDCTSLTSVTIPNSVTSMGNEAFLRCRSLKRVNISDIASWCNIGFGDGSANPLSYAGHLYLNGSEITELNIPSSVTSINHRAFYNCTGLTSVTIPNSITAIGSDAFYGCSGLTRVNISDIASWCNIGFGDGEANPLFYAGHLYLNGSEITELNIPNSVTSISNYAFYNCTGLTSVTIPNSVTSISHYAFYNCTGLTSVTIPNSVTSIGSDAFYGCSGLTRVNISDIASWCIIGFRDGQANPLYYAGHIYLNGSEITELNIPNSVTSISNYAFYNCTGLTSVTIPNSVISISYGAFAGCNGLTSVTIGNSVTSIGNHAFNGCSNLTEIYSLALTPPTIETNTFKGCYGATLYVPKKAVNTYIAANYWKEFTSIMGYVECVGVFEVDGIIYMGMNDGTATVIANEEMENYYIGDKVIADTVSFEGNDYVVTIIEDNAFDGCYELTSVVIPNSVESIGEQAFQGCTGLKSVTIGSGVTTIGAKAFNYCNALETVKCIGTMPPVMASSDCFSTAAYNRAALIVPRNYEATYGAADYWYKFAHIDGWGSAGRGDVNGDGVMSIRDVVTLIDVLLGNEIDSFYFESADLNSNGRIDIGDVASIIDGLLNGF